MSSPIDKHSHGKDGIRSVFSLLVLAMVCSFAGSAGGLAQSAPAAAPPAQPVQATNTPSATPAEKKPDAAADKVADNAAVKIPDPAANETPEQRRLDAQMQERKNQLAVDTAKLLQLANELKAEMDKSSKDTLSVNVIKKADQVEKLAHKVRDEMKLTIGN
jgi:hypothetical protein